MCCDACTHVHKYTYIHMPDTPLFPDFKEKKKSFKLFQQNKIKYMERTENGNIRRYILPFSFFSF